MEKVLSSPVQSPPSTNPPDYLFLELFDKYVRRVADQCDIPEIADRTLVNKIDVSLLGPAQQRGFAEWLASSFYMRISIENALRRGLSVRAIFTENALTHRGEYTVRIE